MSKFPKKSVISIVFSLLILFGVAGQSYATENDVSINETILLSLQGLLEESIEGGDGSYETVLSLLPYDLLTSYLLSTKEEERARYSKMLYIEQQKRATAMLAEVAKAIAREQAADRALSPKKGEPIE